MCNYIIEPCNSDNRRERDKVIKKLKLEAKVLSRGRGSIKISILDNCIMCEYQSKSPLIHNV